MYTIILILTIALMARICSTKNYMRDKSHWSFISLILRPQKLTLTLWSYLRFLRTVQDVPMPRKTKQLPVPHAAVHAKAAPRKPAMTIHSILDAPLLDPKSSRWTIWTINVKRKSTLDQNQSRFVFQMQHQDRKSNCSFSFYTFVPVTRFACPILVLPWKHCAEPILPLSKPLFLESSRKHTSICIGTMD